MDTSTLEIKLSACDVVPLIKEKLVAAGLEFQDIVGIGDGAIYIHLTVKKRQLSDLEQGFEILGVCYALPSSRHVKKVDS